MPHNTGCATWQQLSCTYHLPYSSCSTRAIQKSLTLILNKKIFESSGKSQENGPLALPAPKCLHPSYYSDQCILKLLFILGLSLYYFFIGTIYTVAGHCQLCKTEC